MAKLSDATTEAERELTGYCNFTAGGLTINAASAATFKSAAAYSYLNDGIFKAKAALSAQAFTPGHAVQPFSTVAYYVVALDAAGAVSTTQGFGVVPDVASELTPIGIVKVVTNNNTTFTPGTTALDAAGITASYFDVSVLPAKPNP